MARIYNDPAGGQESSVGSQIRIDHFIKTALIEVKKEQYFSQLADVTAMPKNMGKKIKRFQYVPLLDDANINDQGLDATGQVIVDGNLYGSSKDVGAITGKLPVLSETGGRVNRVGFTRVELEGSIEKYGFFQEYTKESVDFDSDAELEMHVNREMIFGANEITEDLLQIDLLNAAGVVYYAGAATQDTEVSGEEGAECEVTYGDLSKLSVELDNNRCPKHTKIISGSRMVDTRVIRGGRVMYIGSELIETVERMTDYFGNQAFISIAHYADAGTLLNGEHGTVGPFRLVVVPEMMHWEGAGAVETVANAGYRATGGNYNIFPMLVVGDGSFTTIGFQTNGKTVKFAIKHAKPESPESYANDPYGETGFMSIKWYYGFMALRPERIGLVKTVARQ